MTSSNTIRIPAGQVVRLFVDSPDRPGSGCTGAKAGRIEVLNSGVINEKLTNGTDGKNPTQLEVYVYGTAGDSVATPDVAFKNSVKFWGTIYAPNSTLHFWNSADLAGGIVGKEVEFINSAGFTWDARVRDIGLPGGAASERKTWTECQTRRPDPADPESGCGT
jgi:hypothetical protein